MPPALEEKRVSPTRQPRNHSSPLVTPSGRPLRMPGSASTASSGFAGAALASLASASSASRSSIATPDTSRSWCGDTSASFSAPPLVFGPALNGRSADKDALPAAQKASATQTSSALHTSIAAANASSRARTGHSSLSTPGHVVNTEHQAMLLLATLPRSSSSPHPLSTRILTNSNSIVAPSTLSPCAFPSIDTLLKHQDAPEGTPLAVDKAKTQKVQHFLKPSRSKPENCSKESQRVSKQADACAALRRTVLQGRHKTNGTTRSAHTGRAMTRVISAPVPSATMRAAEGALDRTMALRTCTQEAVIKDAQLDERVHAAAEHHLSRVPRVFLRKLDHSPLGGAVLGTPVRAGTKRTRSECYGRASKYLRTESAPEFACAADKLGPPLTPLSEAAEGGRRPLQNGGGSAVYHTPSSLNRAGTRLVKRKEDQDRDRDAAVTLLGLGRA